MRLTTFVRIQLTIFSILTAISLVVMAIQYMQVPSLLGIGRYEVKVELSNAGGLYKTANVTYRGETVGRVVDVEPTTAGVEATLSMYSRIRIPADLDANVDSASAIGEQYVDLMPRTASPPFLRDGDVIPVARTSVPQDIGPMIDTVNRSLEAIPQQNLRTVIDESYRGFNGTGPALGRLLDGAHLLSRDALANIGPITSLLTDAQPVLDATAASDPAIREWARNVNTLTTQLAGDDRTVHGLLVSGKAAADQATALFQQLQPTLPILLGNLVSLGQVAVTWNPALEQLLVLLPEGASVIDTVTYPDRRTTHAAFLSFNLNLNSPPPCTVGFLPASARRSGSAQDTPARTARPLYCALPQSDQNDMRGARNYPCLNNPGKRAPTVEMCESEEPYRPLGTNPWIGEPQPYPNNPNIKPSDFDANDPANSNTAVPPITTATYNPSDGSYVGSDGNLYTQTDIASAMAAGKEASWQTMLNPAR